MLAHILLPVDFSERCLGAARYITGCAERFHSQITLVHVVRRGTDLGCAELGRAVPREALCNECTGDPRQDIDTYLRTELAHLNVKRLLLEGEPSERIVQHAKAENCDLIAMPTHGRAVMSRLLHGSVTAQVLHRAECAVWTSAQLPCGPPPCTEPRLPILCAVDKQPHCAAALEWAQGLAAEYDAPLSVLHVIEPGAVRREPGGTLTGKMTWMATPGEEPEVQIEEGDAASVISDAGAPRMV